MFINNKDNIEGDVALPLRIAGSASLVVALVLVVQPRGEVPQAWASVQQSVQARSLELALTASVAAYPALLVEKDAAVLVLVLVKARLQESMLQQVPAMVWTLLAQETLSPKLPRRLRLPWRGPARSAQPAWQAASCASQFLRPLA